MELAPTAKDVLHREGTARLYRFRRPAGADTGPAGPGAQPRTPVVLIPSLINRWYVLDLRAGSSLVEALVGAGLDVWALDWGVPEDEDRYLTWDDVMARLRRALHVVRRSTGSPQSALLGYCMGGTLAGIHTALYPGEVAALINLAGPFDFSHAGMLGAMVDARYFDAGAIAAAGNIGAHQMQAGFTALRPTAPLAKWLNIAERAGDPAARESFAALEAWASDNIPFPGAAYETYIKELYQSNALIAGRHHVAGKRVDLGAIRCPVLTLAAERDAICPLPAARGLNDHTGGAQEILVVPGGHVGAVVGTRARKELYPHVASWLRRTACSYLN
jgi:polyhydroxyalkanoate synthase subunit PhaC